MRNSRSTTRVQESIRLIRPANVRLPILVTIGTGLGLHVTPSHLVATAVAIAASYAVAAVLNDLRDVDVDRANGRLGPLVVGTVTTQHAHRIVMGADALLVGAQVFLAQPAALLVFATAVALSAAYSSGSLRVQTRGLLGTGLLALCYGVLPIALAASQAPLLPHPSPLRVTAILAALLATTASVLYKDFRDEAGDRAHGKATPAVRFGAARTQRLALGLQCGASLIVTLGPGTLSQLCGLALVGLHVAATASQTTSGLLVHVQRVVLPAFLVTVALVR
jgi:4-hydroxybenzoate polyprenyltransferase